MEQSEPPVLVLVLKYTIEIVVLAVVPKAAYLL